jgi:hypothetical protein
MNFPALRAFFRSRAASTIAVVVLFSLLAGELWCSVRQLSSTADEGAHLYAGYQYWTARDFGLNPEHPPLLKLVAALPLLELPIHPPHPSFHSSKGEEYWGGAEFLYENDADMLLQRARVAASVFTFLLAGLIFAAGYEMFGRRVALFTLLLFVFEPNLLAHGALVTTDMVATCTIFAAVYALYRYAKQRTPVRLLLLGVALGLATAAKFSGVVLLPIFTICLGADFLLGRAQANVTGSGVVAPPASIARTWRWGLGWLGVAAIAWIILWSFYGFTYQARPGFSQLTPTLSAYAMELRHPKETQLILLLARCHVFPESFLYGLVDMQVFGGQMPSFLLGKVYPGATKLYFPVAFLIKNTLPVLILILALPLLLTRQAARWRRELIFLLVPVVVYLGVSLLAPQNIGVRHILPIFPFLLLLAGLAASLLASRGRAGAYAACALVLLHAASSARAFPNYIPYANEAFGGPANTYRLLTDSNTDWGQGLKEIHAYLEQHRIKECWYAPFGGDPFHAASYYHIDCKPLPSGFAKTAGLPIPVVPPELHGAILISGTEAAGAFWGPGARNPYAELLKRQPNAIIGGNTLVFQGDLKLPLASAESHLSAASLLVQQGDLQEAINEFHIAARLAPNSPNVQATVKAALLNSGSDSQADGSSRSLRSARRD